MKTPKEQKVPKALKKTEQLEQQPQSQQPQQIEQPKTPKKPKEPKKLKEPKTSKEPKKPKEIVDKCIECLVKKGSMRSKTNLMLCKDCVKIDKYKLISTTNAKNMYYLKDIDLDDLYDMPGHTGYGYGIYYYLEDIKNTACAKHNTDREHLDEVIRKLSDDKSFCVQARNDRSVEKRNRSIENRKTNLINALREAGLELRNDSKLCAKYISGEIKGGDKELPNIVNRMCQMKYLYDYCHMNECQDIAYEQHCEELKAGYFPDCSVSEMAELIALEKYSNNKYPTVFPWQILPTVPGPVLI